MKNFMRDLTRDDVLALQECAVVTLCGSAKFERDFHDMSERLTLAGLVVFSLAVFPSQKAGAKDWYGADQKDALDLAHMAKIVHSDCVVVLNRGGYVGESTSREVEFARRIRRPTFWLEGRDVPSVQLLLEGRAPLPRGKTVYSIKLDD